MEEKKYDLILQQIKKLGYKMTKPREIILRKMINKNHHISVEELYIELKEEKIGMATIYRTMNLFEKISIVKKVNIDNTSYFELKMFSGKPVHVHFRCKNCKNVYDIDDHNFTLELLKFSQKVQDDYEVNVKDIDLVFSGHCKNCFSKKG